MSGPVNSQAAGILATSGNRRDLPRFSRSLWNSLQSHFVVCLLLTSLFFVIGAAMAQRISVIFGIIGLWVILLDWAPAAGLVRRIVQNVTVSGAGNHQTEADRVPVMLRIGGAVLILWALAAGVIPQQPESALHYEPPGAAISR